MILPEDYASRFSQWRGKGAIEYGAVVFQLKGNKQLFLALQRLQWKLIRNAMGYRVSTYQPPSTFNPVIDSLENIGLNLIQELWERVFTLRTCPLKFAVSCKPLTFPLAFTAEAWAIYKTLFIIHQLQIPSTVIFSDCSSVLQTITSHNITHNNYTISLIRNMYYRAVTEGSKIKVAWIPSQKGITGNERAETLAKRAAIKGKKTSCKVPYIDLYHRSKSILKRRYQTYLENAAMTKDTFYHTHYHTNSVKPWFSRVLPLFRKNIIDSPSCLCGDPYQDADHVIFNCILTRDQTTPLYKYLQEIFPTYFTDIFPLLKNPPSVMSLNTRIFQFM
ncbi:hypothetical protein DBV15_07673 [Temnothorax longispinosus]|uniref:RNase H type-1 domain-containing protein n=1 Tax=Temnothorax longispinosus TaxID=300112 RepID=A0A4S2KPB7_9HYME|nr:hypothetical protein DBV15_07673 [Temnothorax longispinosus]